MNSAERIVENRINLNGYKTVERDRFPAHWSDGFIQELARRPGWIRYFPWDGSAGYGSEVGDTFYYWRVWYEALVDALESLTAGGLSSDDAGAINGIRHSMRTMVDEFDDILHFVCETTGKWERPPLARDLRPVETTS